LIEHVLAERMRRQRRREITIERGTTDDLRTLAPLHYRAGPPGPVQLVLRATDGATLAAILAACRPTLNGPWRDKAWPGRYASTDRRENARRLNAEVRTIARVIVDRPYRGRAVARRLVRAYLDHPLTIRTEAVAAMGSCSPIFTRAGMREIAFARSGRDRRLIAELDAWGVRPRELASADVLRSVVRRPALVHALRVWANASGATRPLLDRDPIDIAVRAAMSLSAPRTAFVAEHGG